MDFIKNGIIKRKLTRKEASKITREVMAMGIKNPDNRVIIAIIKTVDVTNKSRKKLRWNKTNRSAYVSDKSVFGRFLITKEGKNLWSLINKGKEIAHPSTLKMAKEIAEDYITSKTCKP